MTRTYTVRPCLFCSLKPSLTFAAADTDPKRAAAAHSGSLSRLALPHEGTVSGAPPQRCQGARKHVRQLIKEL